jgi:integrase
VANAIATLAETHKPSTVRKSLNVLQQALDHVQLDPNPARDRRIRLPRQRRVQIAPPETDHVEAVVRALPSRYRLPVLALDATAMRISELVELTWGDIDEHAGRWRVRPDTRRRGCPAGSTPSTSTSTPPCAL